MESEKERCGNCGKTFALKGKAYDRKSFDANLKLKNIDKSIKEVLEEEFCVMLTPDEKRKRFLCNSCSWGLLSIAKSRQTTIEAAHSFQESRAATGYLAKKINVRSPYVTPRKVKRLRISSPLKV